MIKNLSIVVVIFFSIVSCTGEKRGSHSKLNRPVRKSSTNTSVKQKQFKHTVKLNKRSSNVFEVNAKINGSPLDFILDTGCSDVSISTAEAIYFLKNGILTEDDLGEIGVAQLANGSKIRTLSFNIKKMEIGGKTLYNVSASITDSKTAPLLLGQSVLSKLGKVNIDYSRRVLEFN